MKAGEFSFDFITNVVQLQGELTQIKRAMGQTFGEAVFQQKDLIRSSERLTAQLEREAATHGKTAEQIRAADVAAKAYALNQAGLTAQAEKLVTAEQKLIEVQKANSAANDNATVSASHYSMGQVVMQSAIRKTTDQFAAGAPISTIFAEHIGTLVEVLQLYAQQSQQTHAASEAATEGLALVGGKAVETGEKVGGFKSVLAAAAGFLAGPWGIAITAGVSVLAILGPKLFETGEAAKAAEKQLKAFEDRQSDMGRFIDATTGKLRAQNVQLALIAKMQLPAQIAAQAGTTQGFVNSGFAAARGALTDTTSGDLLTRKLLDQAIKDAGSNVQVLNRNLAALAQRRPELATLSNTVAGFAGQAAEAAGQIKTLQGRQTVLNTLLSNGTIVTTGMIDRQVALATAHTAVAKAQQHLTDVKEAAAAVDAMDPGPAKTAALAEYRQQLTEASKAVNAAEDAQKAYRKELSEQAKAQREAAKEAKAAAKILEEMGRLNLQPITEQMGKAMSKDWAAEWKNTLKELDDAEKGAADAADQRVKENIQFDHQQLAAFADQARTTANDIADAWGKVGNSIGDAIQVLTEYGEKQRKIDDARAAAGDNQAQLNALNKQSGDLQLNTLMGLATATEGLFKKHSAGAKAAEAAEKALSAIELARTAIDVAGGAAKMFQVSGPAGFGLVAAMLAVMASLGFHGGGSSTPPATNEGTGTTLGASDTASASIKNSIEALSDIDTVTMHYSASMAASLKAIETNIGGLASLLVRSGDISGDTAGIQTGYKANLIGQIGGSSIGGAALGGGLAAAGTAAFGSLSALSFAGAAAGPIGIALGALAGAVLAPVIKSLFGTTTKVVGSGIYGASQDLGGILSNGFDLETYADIQKKKKTFGFTTSNKTSTQYGDADAQTAAQFQLVLKSFYDAIGAAAPLLGKSTSEVESKLDSFVISLGKIDFTGLSGDEITDKLTAVFGAAADQMATAAFPGIEKFQKIGEGLFQTLVRVASTVETVNADLGMLGKSTAGLSLDAKMGLAGLFDSVDDMNSATQAYFSTFYTDAEQAAVKTAQLGTAFTSMGLQLPASIAAYRALVDAQDLTTTAGQTTYAALIKLAPAFADITSGAQDATSAAAIVRERQDLEQKLLELQGDTNAIRAAELAKLDPSNRALQQRIYMLTDEQAATEAATQAAQAAAAAQQAIADERAGLERQLLELNGDTAATRALDLAKIDASNQALQLNIWALQDQAEALAKATAVAQERAGLETTLLGLQGNTAELRARELAALDPSNRALQEQIYSLQDAAAAQEAANTAAEAAAQAADQLRQAWASIADDILAEVARIRGLTTSSTDSYASLLAQFNAATAAARAGDQDAAKSLPEYSKALLDMAAQVATSQQELIRIQAMTANSLSDTAAMINAGAFSANDNTSVTDQPWYGSLADSSSTAPTSGNADLVTEIRNLRAEVVTLREAQLTGFAAVAGPVKRTADNIDRAMRATGGDRLGVAGVGDDGQPYDLARAS